MKKTSLDSNIFGLNRAYVIVNRLRQTSLTINLRISYEESTKLV